MTTPADELRALLALPPSTRISDEEAWLRDNGAAVLALIDAAQDVDDSRRSSRVEYIGAVDRLAAALARLNDPQEQT